MNMYLIVSNPPTEGDDEVRKQIQELLDCVEAALADGDQYDAMEFLNAARVLVEGLEHKRDREKELFKAHQHHQHCD